MGRFISPWLRSSCAAPAPLTHGSCYSYSLCPAPACLPRACGALACTGSQPQERVSGFQPPRPRGKRGAGDWLSDLGSWQSTSASGPDRTNEQPLFSASWCWYGGNRDCPEQGWYLPSSGITSFPPRQLTISQQTGSG